MAYLQDDAYFTSNDDDGLGDDGMNDDEEPLVPEEEMLPEDDLASEWESEDEEN